MDAPEMGPSRISSTPHHGRRRMAEEQSVACLTSPAFRLVGFQIAVEPAHRIVVEHAVEPLRRIVREAEPELSRLVHDEITGPPALSLAPLDLVVHLAEQALDLGTERKLGLTEARHRVFRDVKTQPILGQVAVFLFHLVVDDNPFPRIRYVTGEGRHDRLLQVHGRLIHRLTGLFTNSRSIHFPPLTRYAARKLSGRFVRLPVSYCSRIRTSTMSFLLAASFAICFSNFCQAPVFRFGKPSPSGLPFAGTTLSRLVGPLNRSPIRWKPTSVDLPSWPILRCSASLRPAGLGSTSPPHSMVRRNLPVVQ